MQVGNRCRNLKGPANLEGFLGSWCSWMGCEVVGGVRFHETALLTKAAL